MYMTNKDGLHTGDKPCEYKFQRFIGQGVTIWNAAHPIAVYGVIEDIQPYYTICSLTNGHKVVCTPTDIQPAQPTPHPWLPNKTQDGQTPMCDNCTGCDNKRQGWVCGNWQEETERQLEWRL